LNLWTKINKAITVVSVLGVAVGSGLFIIACSPRKPEAPPPENPPPSQTVDPSATVPAESSTKDSGSPVSSGAQDPTTVPQPDSRIIREIKPDPDPDPMLPAVQKTPTSVGGEKSKPRRPNRKEVETGQPLPRNYME